MRDFIEDNTVSDESFQVVNYFSDGDQRERQASNLIEASTFLLLSLRAPDQVRRIFPALLGMLAGRSSKVSFTRLDLGRRLFRGGYVEEIERKRIEQKMTDYLGAMQDWIHRENLEEVVRYTPGTKTEASIIQTPILRWIVEVADKAGQRLSGTEPDLVRRQVFEGEVKSLLNRKRIGTKRRRESTRRKRTVDPSVYLKTAKAFLKLYLESAKVENDAEQVKSNILREIEGFINRIPTVISGEYLTGDGRKTSGTQGGDDQYLTRFDPTEGTCRVKFQSDDWETINEIGEAARGEVDATLEEKVMVDTPPCVPDADADNLISDGAKAITAITASRQGDHWQAIRLAASVGAVPVHRILGGTGDAIPEREVREVDSIPDFVTSFDGLVRQSTNSQRSLILSLSPCVFHRDDCTSGDVERLSPFSWMITETSSGSYQVWFRLADAESGSDGRRRFHDILTAAGIGGNAGGTHSGRWPGSVNGKAKHQGWRVRLTGGQAGRFVTLGQMVDAFPSLNPLVPVCEVKTTPRDKRSTMISESKSGYRGAMPDYDKCLIGRRSRSEADASFIRIAFDRGFDADEIFSTLVSVSERASSMTESAVRADIRRVMVKYVH